MASGPAELNVFPQSGSQWFRIRDGRLKAYPMNNRYGDLADAARLADGRLLLVTRKIGTTGIEQHLVVAEEKDGVLDLRPLVRLGLGRRENVEGLAVEERRGEGTRLWLITDNDFRPRKATLLVALDLP